METVQEQETIRAEIQTALRHTTVYGLTNILSKAVGFLMLPFYTHYLNPTEYGIVEILDLSMTLFGMFLNMGMTVAILRRYAAAESEEEKRKVISTAFVFVAATGLFIFVLGLGFIRPISAHLLGPTIPAIYFLLSFSSFVLLYITSVPGTYVRALEMSGVALIVQTIGTIAALALNIYFIALLKIGALGILWSSVLVAAVQMLLLCGWVITRTGMSFSIHHLQQMLSYGWPLTFSNLALFVLNFSDRFFLQHLKSLEVVGVYAVGYKFGFIMNFLLIAPFVTMWQPRMYNLHAHPDHCRIFGRIFALYSFVLIYAALVLSVMSPEVVRVMVGPNFAASQRVIPIVVFAYVFWGIGFYAQLGMYLTNRTNLIGIIGAGAAVLNVALNYFLILRYGMLGAAWATLLSFFAIAVANYWVSQRLLPLPLALGRITGALTLSIAFALVPQLWNPQSLSMVLLEKVSILALFPAFVCKAGMLSRAEMSTVISLMDSLRLRFSRTFGLVPQVD